MHFDWGASQFLSKQVMVGLVGYVYKELGCDSSSGDRVGCFQSQVVGIGPQTESCFRSATCRAISISRLTASSLRQTGHPAGFLYLAGAPARGVSDNKTHVRKY